jgi:hypothetical protein
MLWNPTKQEQNNRQQSVTLTNSNYSTRWQKNHYRSQILLVPLLTKLILRIGRCKSWSTQRETWLLFVLFLTWWTNSHLCRVPYRKSSHLHWPEGDKQECRMRPQRQICTEVFLLLIEFNFLLKIS